MLSLSEEVTLVLLDETAGAFIRVPHISRKFALGGSVLLELILKNRIDPDAEHLSVLGTESVENDLLNPLLRRIARSEQGHDVEHWMRDAASHAEDTFKRSLICLVERGILAQRDRRTFGPRRAIRYDIIDPSAAREPKERILSVLSGTDIPDLRDAVLVSLTDACGILQKFLSRTENHSTAERLCQIRSMDRLGRTISRALASVELELVGRLY